MRAVEEQLCLEARRHGVVLARPLIRAVALVGGGAFLLVLPWPVPVLGAAAMSAGAILALAAVWRWDRTRLVVTTRKVVLEEGILRRRESAVLVRGLASIGLERPLLGRLLGYGTIVAGPLRISHVVAPREVSELLEGLISA